MGSVRLLLSLLVAVGHLYPAVPLIPVAIGSHAVSAVRAFFVLSGFYMAAVLSTHYRSPWRFYVARLAKILPVYWFVALATYAAAAIIAHYGSKLFPNVDPISPWELIDIGNMPVSVFAYLAATLTTLFGADSWLWLGFSRADGMWSTAPGYGPLATTALALTAIPQAWTLGVEIWFYILAPFIVRLRTWQILGLIAAAVALRLALFGLVEDNQIERSLFPLESIFFFSGILLFRAFPQIIEFTGKLDSALGALSFPVYMAQFLVFGVLYQAQTAWSISLPWWLSLPVYLGFLIGAGVAIDRLIARPVDNIRVKFGARKRPR